MKPFALRHLQGEPSNRFPVWMMRQAGRYLPEYREVRKSASFWEMVSRPELAAKVSLLPLATLPVDIVIFFSDILTLPYGFGLPIEMKEGVGPVLAEPLKTEKEFLAFQSFDPTKHTPYVGEALTQIREQIPSEIALFGFAGAPWTVACYLIEGGASRHFEKVKAWMYTDPHSLAKALGSLAEATLRHLVYQVKSGAHLVQLFDTWVGEMPQWFFKEHYTPILNSIFDGLNHEQIPSIYFGKNSHHLAKELGDLHVSTLSCDSLCSLTQYEAATGKNFSLQGNLDPILLLKGDEALVRAETKKLVSEARKLAKPAIMNLGHGILPKTPVQNAIAFVEEARAIWT